MTWITKTDFYFFLNIISETWVLVPKRHKFSTFSHLALREIYAYVPRKWAALAQLVEHRIRNAGVGCSSHPGGTILFHIFSRSRARGNQKVAPYQAIRKLIMHFEHFTGDTRDNSASHFD